MIWMIRALFGCLIIAPFVGAMAPGLEIAQAADGSLGRGDVSLVLSALYLAAISTAVELIVCMLALSIILNDRRAAGSLFSLVIVLSVTFLIPAPLRARAFASFWEFVGLGPGDALWLLWSITFNTIFFWAVAVAYTQSDRFQSSLSAVRELSHGWRSMVTVTRMFAPALAAAGVASFVVSLMSGREVIVLTTGRYPVGVPLRDLIGGRDHAAALMCGVLMLLLLGLIVLTWRVGTSSTRTDYRPRRIVKQR